MAHMHQKAVKTCSLHMHKQLTVYCYDCKKTVCFQCFKEDHSEHKSDDVASAARCTKSGMLNQCQVIRENRLPAIQSTIDNIRLKETSSSENYKRHLEEIDTIEEDAINVLKRAFSKHRKDAFEKQENISSTVTDRTKQFQELHWDIGRRTKTLEDEFTVLTDIDVLELNQELNDKLLMIPEKTTEIPIYDVRLKTKKMSTQTVQLLTDIVNDMCSTETIPMMKSGSPLLQVPMIRRSGPAPHSHMAKEMRPYYTKRLVVASLDIGSGYCGYAFSVRKDKILSKLWVNSSLISVKTRTCILMGSDLEMVEVGFDAEYRYAELLEDESRDYYLINDIRTALYQGNTSAKDIRREREIPVNKLWEKIIDFLFKMLYTQLQDLYEGIEWSNVHVVFPLPSLLKDSTFQLVRRRSLTEAVSLITEPEAAVIYAANTTKEEMPSFTLQIEKRVIVVDIGMSSKFACLMIKSNDYTEVVEPALVQIGGHSVNDAFEVVLEEIIGTDTYQTFKTRQATDHLDMMNDFETRKRSKNFTQPITSMLIRVPRSLKDILQERDVTLANLILHSKYNKSVFHRRDKLEIKVVTKEIMSDVIESIIKHLGDFIEKNKLQDVETMILVGGFAECDLLQQQMEHSYSSKNIRVPSESGVAIMKGGVLFGHNY